MSQPCRLQLASVAHDRALFFPAPPPLSLPSPPHPSVACTHDRASSMRVLLLVLYCIGGQAELVDISAAVAAIQQKLDAIHRSQALLDE